MVPRAGIEPATPGFSVRPGCAGTKWGRILRGSALLSPAIRPRVPPIFPPSNKEYSPGFLTCPASIAAMSVNYRLDDGKLILSDPGTDESHELHRESP